MSAPGRESPPPPAGQAGPQAPSPAALRALAGRHLAGRAAERDGWPRLLAAVAANLQHGFTAAVLIDAQAAGAAAASYDDWRSAGWQVPRDQHARAWILTPAGERVAVFTRDQVRPSRRGAAPPLPGMPAIAAGSAGRAAGALTSQARRLGYTVTRPDGTGSPAFTDWAQRTITVPASMEPAAAAAALAHELAHILGDAEITKMYAAAGQERPAKPAVETTADCYGAPAAEADSVAWLVLGRLGVDPAAAGIRLQPLRAWVGADSRIPAAAVITAAGERISAAAREIREHAGKVLAAMPPPPSPAEVPAAVAEPARRGGVGGARPKARHPDAAPLLVVTDRPSWPVPDREVVQVNMAAVAYFRGRLPSSGWAAGYLSRRGLGAGIWRRWQLGYAPEGWTALRDHLREARYPDGTARFTDAAMEAAGLVRPGGRSGDMIDVFTNRVMIPVRGPSGQVVGFAGRAPDTAREGTPKYLNSKASLVYQKDHLLFGLPEGAAALQAGARPAMVEGYTDVIAVDEAAMPALAGVAPMGTAVTEHQMALLAAECDLARTPLLWVMDPDAAGLKATLRVFPLIYRYSPTATTPVLPAGPDPAEIFGTGGPVALEQALRAGEHPLTDVAVDAVLSRWAVSLERGEAEGQLGATREAARLLALVSRDDQARQIVRVAKRTGLPHAEVAVEFAGVIAQVEAEGEPPPKAPGTRTGRPGPAVPLASSRHRRRRDPPPARWRG